jgi:hypothetical protein
MLNELLVIMLYFSVFLSLLFPFVFFFWGGRGGTDFALTCDFIMLDLHIPPCRPKVCMFLIHYLMELTIHIYMWSVRLFIFLIFNVFIYKFKL